MTVIKDWHIGGIADSKRQGLKNSAYKLENCDIHSDPGILKCNFELIDDGNSSIVTSSVVAIVKTSSNGSYFFCVDGKVYNRTNGAVYSLLGEIPSGANYNQIFDAKIFNGDVYYTMEQRVGKYTPGDSWNNDTADGTQNNFKNIDFDYYHPLIVIENDLFVGNINNVGKITPTETAGGDIEEVLTLDSICNIQSFGYLGRNLIIGAGTNGNTNYYSEYSRIFRWDLVSNSWSTEQSIKEFGISAFFFLDGSLIFNAGENGSLYSYDGENIRRFKKIPYIEGERINITKNAIVTDDGILMFGVSDILTGSAELGIYSLGGYDKKYPNIFNLPFSLTGKLIRVLNKIGVNMIICYGGNSTGVVKKIGTSRETVVLETLIYDINKPFSPKINYADYPSGTTIGLEISINSGDYKSLTLTKQPKNILTTRKILEARTMQFKLTLTPNGSSTPEIESIEF